jgi:membrane-bound lytic murein transglycosylase D
MIPEEGRILSPAVWLAMGACAVTLGTVRLVAAGGSLQEAEPPRVVEAVEVMPDVVALGANRVGMVTAAHPLLPPRFHGIDDEILASPMLHHPPFAAEVEVWVEKWSSTFSRSMPTYLERMTSFAAVVDVTLDERSLPPSLRYLPVIESGYSPTAVSSASAVGMWQFMAPTARDLGVEVTPLVDDRRDPFVSTGAAVQYLDFLRGKYGSWFLALAAYNAGPERIDGLIERYLPDVEPSDAVYWALRNVLPTETAAFVPNFLGAVIVASDPVAYGYSTPQVSPFDFETIAVQGSVSFATIARATGRSTDEIAWLNPEYLRGMTPPDRQVDLRLPPGSGAAFRAYFAQATDGDG